MKIYQPSEDSYLLSETLKDYLINLIKENKEGMRKGSIINQQKLHSPKRVRHINNICKNKKISILDMGSGYGIQAETCRKLGYNNIITADINPDAIKQLKVQGFRAIKSNLFFNINKKDKFNLIIFNPPYLPEDKYDKETDTTGGEDGYELIIEFLRQAKEHLNKNAEILLLISTLTNPDKVNNKAKKLGYNMKLLNKKKLFFEELLVYSITLKSSNI